MMILYIVAQKLLKAYLFKLKLIQHIVNWEKIFIKLLLSFLIIL